MSYDVTLLSGKRYHWWQLAVILLAVVALTGSLATRTFNVQITNSRAAKAVSADSVRQHMDRDAVGWMSPAPRVVTLHLPVFSPHLPSPESRPQRLLLEENFYNRPPPFC